MQLDVVQDSKDSLCELPVTKYTYGFTLTSCTFESSIVKLVDDCGKDELQRGLAAPYL